MNFKYSLTLLFFCFLINYSNAQHGSHLELKFDFKTKQFTINDLNELDKLKEGQYYQLVINNINTYTNKVTISNRDTILETLLTFPNISGINFSGFSGLINNINDLSLKIFSPLGDLENSDVSTLPLIKTAIYDRKIDNQNKARKRINNEVGKLKEHTPEVNKIKDKIDKWVKLESEFRYDITPHVYDMKELEKRIPKTSPIKKVIKDDLEKYEKDMERFKKELENKKIKEAHQKVLDDYNKILLAFISEAEKKIKEDKKKILIK